MARVVVLGVITVVLWSWLLGARSYFDRRWPTMPSFGGILLQLGGAFFLMAAWLTVAFLWPASYVH